MKKLLLFIALVFYFGNSYSQNYNSFFTIGAGVSYFDKDVKESSNLGVNFSLSIGKVYFDVASNFSTGQGEELDFSSSETYKTDKISLGVVNVGYIINLKKFSVIPVLGYGWSTEIFEDPIAFDTYFYGDNEAHFNTGIKGSYLIGNNMAVNLGVGLFERFSGGISYVF